MPHDPVQFWQPFRKWTLLKVIDPFRIVLQFSITRHGIILRFNNSISLKSRPVRASHQDRREGSVQVQVPV